MKPGDPRLLKNLTLGEFIVAFGKYKNIICEVIPHRRTELDEYERNVVEMTIMVGLVSMTTIRYSQLKRQLCCINDRLKLIGLSVTMVCSAPCLLELK